MRRGLALGYQRISTVISKINLDYLQSMADYITEYCHSFVVGNVSILQPTPACANGYMQNNGDLIINLPQSIN
jgi:hypothetical protein